MFARFSCPIFWTAVSKRLECTCPTRHFSPKKLVGIDYRSGIGVFFRPWPRSLLAVSIPAAPLGTLTGGGYAAITTLAVVCWIITGARVAFRKGAARHAGVPVLRARLSSAALGILNLARFSLEAIFARACVRGCALAVTVAPVKFVT